MKNASKLRSTYSTLMAINAYALCLAFYMDIIMHNDDLKTFMKTFRVVNSTSVLIGCSKFKVGQTLKCSSVPMLYLPPGKTASG
jgi:hypothetical protein